MYIRDTHLCEDSMDFQNTTNEESGGAVNDMFGKLVEDRTDTCGRPGLPPILTEASHQARFYFLMPVLSLGPTCKTVHCEFPFHNSTDRQKIRRDAQIRVAQYISTRSDVFYSKETQSFRAYCPDGTIEEFRTAEFPSVQKTYDAAVDFRLNFLPRFATKADETLSLLFDDYAAHLQKLRSIDENTTLEMDARDETKPPVLETPNPGEELDVVDDSTSDAHEAGVASIHKHLGMSFEGTQHSDEDMDEAFIGRCVCRKLGDAWYTGHVQELLVSDEKDTNADPEFIVSYCDGEVERLSKKKLLPLLFDPELLLGRQVRIASETGTDQLGTVVDIVRCPSSGRRQLTYTIHFEDHLTGQYPQATVVRSLLHGAQSLLPSADGRFERAPDTHRLVGGHIRQWVGARPIVGIIA